MIDEPNRHSIVVETEMFGKMSMALINKITKMSGSTAQRWKGSSSNAHYEWRFKNQNQLFKATWIMASAGFLRTHIGLN